MKTALILLSLLIITGCSSSPNKEEHPVSHSEINTTKPTENLYVDLSASERCRIKEQPSIKDGKLQLKPIIDKEGNWVCDTKPVTYWITLNVKNTENKSKEYKLECDNPYGLMKDCKGWNAWMEELGPGPFVIETKGKPEMESKFVKPVPTQMQK